MNTCDTLIFGAGPAGLTAGIYLSRARQKVVILDTGTGGGQVLLTHAVANYPGIPETNGYKLASEMKKQALGFGCEILTNQKIRSIDFSGRMKKIETEKGVFQAKTVIIATGGKPRTLGLDSEMKFQGTGISYCATCDGDFFTNEDIIVVGGGNSALEEAVSLTQYAKAVTIVHQFDHFQGYPHAINAAETNPKISFMMESEIEEFIGGETLTGARIRKKKTGEISKIDATGAFVLIGYVPSSGPFTDTLEINQRGEIVTDEGMETNVPGVFAAGDIKAKKIRQITTAVNDGTIAALNTMEYLYGADPDKI
ncbi:MAG: FAD-dependent oxidoreductase [Spirochaetaceae bacterium]|nr:FAD-dependent oxidoreductase [Spirochaetaceae bacterium]